MCQVCDFVHLHNHTVYSKLDGAISANLLFDRLKELNMDSFAKTDHGTLAGTMEFMTAATKAGVKLICGCEFYEVNDIREKFIGDGADCRTPDKIKREDAPDERPDQKKQKYWHVTMLAKDKTGYDQLVKLSSAANTQDAYFFKPRIDGKMIAEIIGDNKGHIKLGTGCAISRMSKTALSNDNIGALDKDLDYYHKLFGADDIYVEIMATGYDAQKEINVKLIELAEKRGLPIVVTNDCLSPNTPVYTDSGAKLLGDIVPGDRVLTHKGRYRKVVATGAKITDEKLYDISLSYSDKVTSNFVTATENHKWWVYSVNTRECSLIKTKDLDPAKHRFVFPKIKEQELVNIDTLDFAELKADSSADEERLTEDIAYVLGLFAGDGHAAAHTNAVSICVNKTNKNASSILSFMERFGTVTKVTEKYKTLDVYRITNRYLSRWLRKHFYDSSGIKIVPTWLYKNKSAEIRKAFLRGIIDADGHINARGVVSFTNTSLNLVAAVQFAMNSLGAFHTIKISSIGGESTMNGWHGFCKKQYTWSSLAIHNAVLNDVFGLKLDINSKVCKYYFEDADNWYSYFRAKLSKQNNYVCDIEVEEDHTFTTIYGCSKNCHYLTEEHARLQDILVCISTNQYVDGERNFKFEGSNYFVKTPDQLRKIFKETQGIDVKQEWFDNSRLIANSCEHCGYAKDPEFKLPQYTVQRDRLFGEFKDWVEGNAELLAERFGATPAEIGKLLEISE